MQESTIPRLPQSRFPVIAHDRIGGDDQGIISHSFEMFLPLLAIVYAVFESAIRAEMSRTREQLTDALGLADFCSSSFQVGITTDVSLSTIKAENSLLARLWYDK